MERPDFFELKNGEKVKLPFTDKEYNDRVSTVSYTHLTLPTTSPV